MSRKTLDELKKEMAEINDTIDIIGEYVNCHTPIQYQCKLCGITHKATPSMLLKGQGCPKCAISRRAQKRMISHDEFVKRVSEINPNIQIVSEYKGRKNQIEFLCLQCQKHLFTTPEVLLGGHGCNYCEHQKGFIKRRKTHEQFENEIKELHPNITLLSKYSGAKTNIECQCNVCSHTWTITPDRLLNKKGGCPKCTMVKQVEKMTKSQDVFQYELSQINDSLEVIGSYINNATKIEVKCHKCDRVFEAIPRNLLNRGNCPLCVSSKGEDRIASVLQNHNIEFYQEKTFNNLISDNNGHLRFDFYLPNQNLLIEYQGIQHNKPIDFGSKGDGYAKAQFVKQKRNDEIKRRFANDNGYNFLEIWYYDFDKIETIINSKLNEISVIKK